MHSNSGQKKIPEKFSSLTKEQNCYTLLYRCTSWQNQGIWKVSGGICIPVLHGKNKNYISERCVTLEVAFFGIITAEKQQMGQNKTISKNKLLLNINQNDSSLYCDHSSKIQFTI